MPFTAQPKIAEAVAQLQRAGKLPNGLSPQQLAQLQRAMDKYSGEVSDRLLAKVLEEFQSKIQTAQSATDPVVRRGLLADLGAFTPPQLVDKMKFAFDTMQQVASGAGKFLNQNLSPEALDEYPALELKRLFQRDVPRGEKLVKGALVDDEENSWPSRWEAAGGTFVDGDRMIALKSSGIWQALGDGVGGYTDTLGNPYPPFAFNSGFTTVEISRKEAEALGVIDPDMDAEPAQFDFSTLFAPVAA
jgi:hypothetical protein